MSKVFSLAIDARPLCHQKSGIGRYTSAIVSKLATLPEVELYLYAHRPFATEFLGDCANEVRIRTGSLTGASVSTIFCQALFPIWAHRDGVDLYWSPRHHLPVALFKPSVVTIHDMVWQKAPGTMQRGARLLESLLMPFALRRSDSILTVSMSTAKDIEETYPECALKIATIPLASYRPTSPDPPATSAIAPFIFVGTIEPRKNLARVIKAYSEYARGRRSPRAMIIAGTRGWGTSPEKLWGENSAGEIIFVDSPDDAELEKLYRDCHCLVMPSLYEGFGLPILEAYSFGKPAITSCVSSMPEVAGSGALLVNPRSVPEMVVAMNRIADDEKLWVQLAENAKQQSSLFSWEQTAHQSWQAIQATLSKPSAN